MYTVDVLIQGFPGRAVCHGGLGWSTISLLRGAQRAVLVDVGAFGVRKPLAKQLGQRRVAPEDVTDVVLTHVHYDHAVNFTLFPKATIWVGRKELEWAAAAQPDFNPLPELYVQELRRLDRVRMLDEGDEFLPGITAISSGGHTPGHLMYLLAESEVPVLFTGDAAKNRAELLAMDVSDTSDRSASIGTLERIWETWRRVPGTLLIPGHDLPMQLDEAGQPVYVGERSAGITAWFSQSLAQTTTIDLCRGLPSGIFSELIRSRAGL